MAFVIHMRYWAKEKKIAATITLLLIGISCLAGAGKVFTTVGATPEAIEKRYSGLKGGGGREGGTDLESFLSQPPETLSFEKMVHIAHVHLLPYAFLFALTSFFILNLGWSATSKSIFLVVFSLSIVGDFAFMSLTRFLNSGFSFGIIASGFIFGLSVATIITSSLYELWIKKD